MASHGLSDLLAVAITPVRTPKTSSEVPALIRRMSRGGLLKLGIDVSQTTVGRHLPRLHSAPSQLAPRTLLDSQPRWPLQPLDQVIIFNETHLRRPVIFAIIIGVERICH